MTTGISFPKKKKTIDTKRTGTFLILKIDTLIVTEHLLIAGITFKFKEEENRREKFTSSAQINTKEKSI